MMGFEKCCPNKFAWYAWIRETTADACWAPPTESRGYFISSRQECPNHSKTKGRLGLKYFILLQLQSSKSWPHGMITVSNFWSLTLETHSLRPSAPRAASKTLSRGFTYWCTLRAPALWTFTVVLFVSKLAGCIKFWLAAWQHRTVKKLNRAVKKAAKITGRELPELHDIWNSHCRKETGNIIKDTSNPAHSLCSVFTS